MLKDSTFTKSEVTSTLLKILNTIASHMFKKHLLADLKLAPNAFSTTKVQSVLEISVSQEPTHAKEPVSALPQELLEHTDLSCIILYFFTYTLIYFP